MIQPVSLHNMKFKELKKRIRRNSGWRYKLYSIATYPIWKVRMIYWKIRYKG